MERLTKYDTDGQAMMDCEVPEDFFCFYGERKDVG